jgi:hypothetical protein
LHKYESVLRSQEKLREAGYDARLLPHEEPLQTLLRWFSERTEVARLGIQTAQLVPMFWDCDWSSSGTITTTRSGAAKA